MKINVIFAILVLGLSMLNSTEAFQEKFLLRAMGQKNFSASLMSSAMDVARDLKDQTGCLHDTELKPNKDKFVICDLNEIVSTDSRCHLIDVKENSVKASGPVVFGSKGVSSHGNQNTANKTLLGAFITTFELSEKSNTYTRQLVRANGSAIPENSNPQFKPSARRIPANTKGPTVVTGEFADNLKNESSNLIWVNHSVKHPYDNACGNIASRKSYESDMSDVQLAEFKAKSKPNASKRGIASEKASAKPKRGLASEKE